MTARLDPDVCVLGQGPVAAQMAVAAAQLGAKVVLAAPAAGPPPRPLALKALMALAQSGLTEWNAIRTRIAVVEAASAQAEAPARLAALGVTLLDGPGHFISATELQAGIHPIRARRFIIVPCGQSPSAADAVLALPAVPEHVVIGGGGAEAVMVAQALARLGARVTLAAETLLPRFDAELVEVLRHRLVRDGIGIGPDECGAVRLEVPEMRAALAGLGLAEAGIAWGEENGIVTQASGRTTNRHIWATPFAAPLHPAAQAGAELKSALLRLPVAAPPTLLVAFTDPELVQVGLDEAGMRALGRPFRLLRWPVAAMDQVRADGRQDGVVKVVLDRRGRVLGAGIAAPRASELIAPWALAVARHLPVSAVAEAPLPSPSLGDASRLAAASAVMPLLLSGKLQRWVQLMLKF